MERCFQRELVKSVWQNLAPSGSSRLYVLVLQSESLISRYELHVYSLENRGLFHLLPFQPPASRLRRPP
jgi:hypothetical protein